MSIPLLHAFIFHSNSSHLVSGTKMLLVDVVAAEGNAWVKVVARKSKALHQAWLGKFRVYLDLIICSVKFVKIA